MEFGEFLAYAVRRNVCIMSDHLLESYSIGGITKVPASFMYALADLTEGLDYGCGFDSEGICQRNRNPQFIQGMDASSRRRKQCCCGGCATSVGYLRQITFGSVSEYARNFTEETGFWREGLGCVLPRRLRSATCLRHYCTEFDPKTNQYIQLQPRIRTIVMFFHDIAAMYLDYNGWYNLQRNPRWLFGSVPSLSDYVDAWVIRRPEGLGSFSYPKVEPWKEYYAKNSNVSKSDAQSRS